MVSPEIKNIVESMIFASEEEINPKQLKEIIDRSGLRVSISEIEESIELLNTDFRNSGKPYEIIKIAGGYAFATKKDYGRFVGKLFEEKQKKKLSQSALETLSVIAYKQPVTRSEIEFIRGVNVDYIVNSLLEKDLITITGRSETPGRPILYGTTKTFLKVLGLNSLDDLPKLKEINEILKNEEIEGITEADIELFNSVNAQEISHEHETSHQLELLTSSDNSDADEPDESVQDEIIQQESSAGEDISVDDNSDEEIPDGENSQKDIFSDENSGDENYREDIPENKLPDEDPEEEINSDEKDMNTGGGIASGKDDKQNGNI